jgi:serine/threonine protein kinase
MHAYSFQSQPQIDAGNAAAVQVADLLIEAALIRQASVLWIEPGEPEGVHMVTLERDGRRLADADLPAGMGEAVIARFALLCDLSGWQGRAETGRTRVRCGLHNADVVVTARPSASGPRAEILFRATGPATAVVLPERLPTGTAVGPYRVVEQLGAGGMGCVYRVVHGALGREFAMKVLHSGPVADGTFSAERFLAEARAAARIRHGSIVSVTDFGQLDDGRPFLVMELLDGSGLDGTIEEGALEPVMAVAIARGIAEALHAAHEAGVIHGDLSPSNVAIAERDGAPPRVTLFDFGSAHVRGTVAGVSDVVVGTPFYISPEQIGGEPPDERSDLYSLGVILYEMLTGDPPFVASTVPEILHHHLFTQARLPNSRYGALPVELCRAVLRCLRKTRDGRYGSAAELAEELGRIELGMQRKGWRKWVGR